MEPFQIVRMGHPSLVGTGGSGLAGAFLPRTVQSDGDAGVPTRPRRDGAREPRTIPRLWQDAVAAARASPPTSSSGTGGWRAVSWDRGGTAVEELANGLLALGFARATRRDPRPDDASSGRSSTARSRRGRRRRRRSTRPAPPKECAYILDHSEAVGVLVEDDEQRAKLDGRRARSSAPRHVLTFAELDDLRARGREHAAAHPDALAEPTTTVDEDDLFTYIYTSGTTGPPKALHDPPPQLLRDGGDRRRDRRLHRGPTTRCSSTCRSRTTSAGSCTCSAPYVGFTVAFCPDPLAAAEALEAVQPTTSRACRASTRRCTRASRRSSTRRPAQAQDRRLGARRRRSASASRASERQARAAPCSRVQHRLADRLVFSKVQGEARRPPPRRRSRAARRSRRIARVLPPLGILCSRGTA